jgi:hypothetical protein
MLVVTQIFDCRVNRRLSVPDHRLAAERRPGRPEQDQATIWATLTDATPPPPSSTTPA